MKKQIIFLLFAFVVFYSNSQIKIGVTKMNYDNAQKFLKTKLIIAIDENDKTGVYDSFKESMQKYWKYNEYEFVKPSDAEKYLKNENYSVLAMITNTINAINSKDGVYSYSYNLMLGKKNYSSLEDATVLASVILPSVYNEKKKSEILLDYNHLTHFLIKDIINQISDKLNKAPDPKVKRFGKAFYYHKGEDYDVLQAKKVIYICDGCVSKKFHIDDFCYIFEIESDKVKFISKEKFSEMLEEQDAEAAFIFNYYDDSGSIYDAKTFRIIATNDTGEL